MKVIINLYLPDISWNDMDVSAESAPRVPLFSAPSCTFSAEAAALILMQ